MKNIGVVLILMLALSGPRCACADTAIDLPGLGSLDLTNFISNTGVMGAIDNHGTKWAGATVRFLWYPNNAANPTDPADNAYMGLEGGVLWEPSTGKPSGAMAWCGLRADTLAGKIFGRIPQLGYLKVPAVEFGPMGCYLTDRKEWVYGAAFAKHF